MNSEPNLSQSILKSLSIKAARIIGLTICLGWILLTLGLWIFQEKLIFPANPHPPRTNPERYNIPFQQHRIRTADNEELDVWWMPQKGGTPVFFCHGNAGNLEDRLLIFKYLHKAGFQVLAFDYRGYGSSTGQPSESGLYSDADAVWNFAMENLQIEPEEWIMHGRSLGGGVASYLASKHKVKALVLESTFTSVIDVASDKYPFLPVRTIARHHFPTHERLQTLSLPILVIHSPSDRTIDIHHGKSLYEAGKSIKKYLEVSGGHNNTWHQDGPKITTAYKDFVSKLGSSKPQRE